MKTDKSEDLRSLKEIEANTRHIKILLSDVLSEIRMWKKNRGEQSEY